MTKLKKTIATLPWRAKTSYEKQAFSVLLKLQKSGFDSYFVGGFVRDLLMGRKELGDIDIATAATPAQVAKIFGSKGVVKRDARFGTIRVLIDGEALEVTTFRSEKQYNDSRHPEKVIFINKAEEDAKRRDFTINAFFFNPVTHEVVDFFDGKKDLENKQIRCIGDPHERFSEDGLRMLRALRFVSTLGFEMEKGTADAIRKDGQIIQKVSVERIRVELEKLLLGENATRALLEMQELWFFKYLIPEISILFSIKQDSIFHAEGDVFTHTLMTLDNLPKDADLPLRFAALLHDVGKAFTTKEILKGDRKTVVSYNHENIGADLVPRILGPSGLKFDNKSIAKIQWLVRNHMIVYHLSEMRHSKQMKWATHKWFPDLLALDKADLLGRKTSKVDVLKGNRNGQKLLREAQKLLDGKTLEQHLKTIVTGEDVKRVLGLESSPRVGYALREIRDLFYKGTIRTRKQALAHLAAKKKLLDVRLDSK